MANDNGRPKSLTRSQRRRLAVKVAALQKSCRHVKEQLADHDRRLAVLEGKPPSVPPKRGR